MDPVSSLSVLIAPVFAGIIFDTSGSYQLAFLVLAAVNALGALLLIGVTVPTRQQLATENPEAMDREINPS